MNYPSWNILIIDDHELIASGIESLLLKTFPTVSTESSSQKEEIFEAIDNHNYDLYIVDLELKDITGFELIKRIREKNVNARILICTMHEEIWYIRELNLLQINGIILKSSCKTSLIEAVTTIMKGNIYYCSRFKYYGKNNATYKYHHLKEENFSQMEMQILHLIAQGYTTNKIGEVIGWSVKTVEHYRKRLFDKFGVSNVSRLIALAMKEGFLKKEDI